MEKTKIKYDIALNCQSGKTTKTLSNIKKNSKADNIYLTAAQNHIAEDAIEKAKEQNLRLDLITPNATQLFQDRFKEGIVTPQNLIGLCNYSTIKTLPLLLGGEAKFGIKQNIYVDESDQVYMFERSVKNPSIRDTEIDWIIQNNLVSSATGITSSFQDVAYLLQNIEFNIIEPYPGFQGLEDAYYRNIDPAIFEEVFKARKNDTDLPKRFSALIESLPQNTIINIFSKNADQEWLKGKLKNAGLFNGIVKEQTSIIIGANSLGRSASFSQNCILYYRKVFPCFSQVEQALGRVNGTTRPYIATTAAIWDFVSAGFQWKKEALEEGAFHFNTEERVKYFENKPVPKPSKFSNPRAVRTVTELKKEHLSGSKHNLVEKYEMIFIGEKLWKEKWAGDEVGRTLLSIANEQHPGLGVYEAVSKGGYKTIMNIKEETKFRDGSRVVNVRLGKNRNKSGWGYVIIKVGEYSGEYSFYQHNGKISSSKSTYVGCLSAA